MINKVVTLDDKAYSVKFDEFVEYTHAWVSPLTFYPAKSLLDKEIAIINRLNYSVLIDCGTTNGGYVPLNVTTPQVYVIQTDDIHIINIEKNDINKKIKVFPDIKDICSEIKDIDDVIVRVDSNSMVDRIDCEYGIIISNVEIIHVNYTSIKWDNRYVNIKRRNWRKFKELFNLYLTVEDDAYILKYDNLINLMFMVKDAGDDFKSILESNLPFIDQYTILDTGSSDNTVNIIKETLKNKEGVLYQEPFINFRDSRNRLIELSGHKCVFNIMLDDTYILKGNLREFLTMMRSSNANAFNLVIKGIGILYGSCRIARSSKNYKYKYRIHEILDTKKENSYRINDEISYIQDINSSYMEERTKKRKENDLALLFEELEENRSDSRTYYYIAETYLCLQDWKNAFSYYEKRSKMDGYEEEKQDALYKMGVVGEIYLKLEWKKCQEYYFNCHLFDPNRCESMFMIGSHYMEINPDLAYNFLRYAFHIGIPGPKYGMNIKPAIYYYHLPEKLISLCYIKKNYSFGLECCNRIKEKNNTNLNENWIALFTILNKNLEYKTKFTTKKQNPYGADKKLLCFVTDGGWKEWDGESYKREGLGGSETTMINFAEYIMKLYNRYTVVIFCKCKEKKIFNDVIYIPIAEYIKFVSEYEHVALINRYTEYFPLCIENNIKAYIMLHDLTRDSEIIINDTNLSSILTLSNWHAEYIKKVFPTLTDKITTFSYGIDLERFKGTFTKKKNSFIYSSFPNRGLYHLLKIFPRIVNKYPDAKLNVFCNLELDWVNKVSEKEIIEIKKMLFEQSENVTNHGWVNSDVLYRYWKETEYWFYPCTFQETCCLTAYEAAASNTLAITNNLAALKESVGDRGIIISENVNDEGWENLVLERIFNVMDGVEDKEEYLVKNKEWIKNKDYNIVVKQFIEFIDAK